MREHAPQRKHSLRELFNGLRYIARTGLQWRFMPTDLPPWHAVYQQTRRWIEAGVFDAIIADLRALIRLGEGRNPQPSAMILDSRTLQSTPESGGRAGWDGAKRRKGTKVHLAVDTLGHLLALHVTPANEQDWAQVAEMAALVQAATGETVEIAYVDQGYTGETPRQAAADHGIQLEVVKLPDVKRGFVLLPRVLSRSKYARSRSADRSRASSCSFLRSAASNASSSRSRDSCHASRAVGWTLITSV